MQIVPGHLAYGPLEISVAVEGLVHFVQVHATRATLLDDGAELFDSGLPILDVRGQLLGAGDDDLVDDLLLGVTHV